MAASKSIRDEFDTLHTAVLELQTFAQVSIDLAGTAERAPQWPFLVSQLVDRLVIASEGLEATMHRKVFPVMDDMAKITLS